MTDREKAILAYRRDPLSDQTGRLPVEAVKTMHKRAEHIKS